MSFIYNEQNYFSLITYVFKLYVAKTEKCVSQCVDWTEVFISV